MRDDGKPLLQTLRGNVLQRPPLWMMRQAGRYLPEYRQLRSTAGSFLDLCYNAEFSAEVTLQPLRRFNFDAAIIFSDILVVPHALGLHLEFREGEGPHLQTLDETSVVNGLKDEMDPRFINPVYEALREVKKVLTQDFPETTLIGFVGAPWTLATYIAEGKGSADHGAAKRWAYRNPDNFSLLIEKLTHFLVQHLVGQIKAGAEVVQIFDSWGGELPPEQFERWCIEPTLKIVNGVREHYPNIPIICFPRACGTKIIRFAEAVKNVCIGVDTIEDPLTLNRYIEKTCVLQGNLDPMALIAGGKALDKAVDTIINGFSGRPFIFNLGHGIRKETPVAHVEQLVKRVRNLS